MNQPPSIASAFHRHFGRYRRGTILVAVMILGSLLVAVASGVLAFSVYQTRDRARYEVYKDEFAAAEVALNKAFSQVQFLINFGTPTFFEAMDHIAPPVVAGYSFPNFTVQKTFDGNEEVSSGQWTGLNLYRLRYQIDVTALSEEGNAERFEHAGVSIRENLEITYIPLFIFAIFYDPIMEIAPGPEMQINGLVHANSDAYFQSGNGLDFLKNVTVGGNVFHGRHPDAGESVSNGDVRFSNGLGLSSMRRADGDGWLTSADADWATAAMDRWNGGLRDSTQGVRPLSLPIPAEVDPHAIIERADPANDSYSLKNEKFEYKAGLKIIQASDGTIHAYDQFDSEVSLTYTDPDNPSVTKSIVATKTFYDAREGKNVTSTDVDMANMLESGIVPSNGILYVSSDQSGSHVVRLKNGAELPSPAGTTGLSVATDLPLYIQGDYNTVNKNMAMVAADALYILSNNWDDAKASNYSERKAGNTEVNAVCMQGIVPSEDDNYSGGVENYFRFLEKWTDKEFKFSGSIINMWESQKALGAWHYGSPVYEAPKR
ncbi:hypothetical protein HQ520_18395, partial [bacterium]|nr:hypothetical protein [bacterium]